MQVQATTTLTKNQNAFGVFLGQGWTGGGWGVLAYFSASFKCTFQTVKFGIVQLFLMLYQGNLDLRNCSITVA